MIQMIKMGQSTVPPWTKAMQARNDFVFIYALNFSETGGERVSDFLFKSCWCNDQLIGDGEFSS